ncbi:hypothetical protein COV15_02770 [Candidatus Woesearchaeota archaeon CG10_big_fil_rev_8_21_14_0_10_34_12]|nr:MAG: hypothetical protein COV15_02770 [Candidatus Woesearchaeota archaeon CG10_big_fil_rev_8_21_14_0_10_34_12]
MKRQNTEFETLKDYMDNNQGKGGDSPSYFLGETNITREGHRVYRVSSPAVDVNGLRVQPCEVKMDMIIVQEEIVHLYVRQHLKDRIFQVNGQKIVMIKPDSSPVFS